MASQQLRTGVLQQQQRLVHANRVRTKQLLLDRQRRRLQQQLVRVGRELDAERTAYEQLCPLIVSAHRELRAERTACVQLARRCVALGRRTLSSPTADAAMVYT